MVNSLWQLRLRKPFLLAPEGKISISIPNHLSAKTLKTKRATRRLLFLIQCCVNDYRCAFRNLARLSLSFLRCICGKIGLRGPWLVRYCLNFFGFSFFSLLEDDFSALASDFPSSPPE